MSEIVALHWRQAVERQRKEKEQRAVFTRVPTAVVATGVLLQHWARADMTLILSFRKV